MISRKKQVFLIIFLIHFLSIKLFSANSTSGIQVCDELFNILQEKNYNPQVQNLVSKGSNQFPYNIIIQNASLEEDNSNEELIFFFKMEEIINYRNILFNLADKLKEENIRSTIILSCNEFSIPQVENNIKGSKIFINSLNTNRKNYVFLINLNAERNSFICGSKGKTAPSWMIRSVFTAYSQQGFTKDIPLYYLSQYSKFSFLSDELLQSFLSNDIPAIKLDFHLDFFTSYTDLNRTSNTLLTLIDNYKNDSHTINDYHSFMIKLFKKSIWFSEYTIVKIILVLLFFILLFVFFIGFINTRLRNKTWIEIRKNWHVIPATFLLSLMGFYIGKFLYILLNKIHPFSGTAYGIVIIQILIAGAFVSFFYLVEMFYVKSYSGKSVDFIILMTTLINLFLFTIIDISLFPVFFAITLLAILSLIVRKNWTHILLFIFIINVFIPYIFYIYNYTSFQVLRQFFMRSNWSCLVFSLILLPVFLMLLRIFTAVKKRFTQKKVFIIIIASTYVFFVIFLFSMNKIFFTKNNTANPLVKTISDPSISIELNYEDKRIFGDIIREVKIQVPEESTYVEFKVYSNQDNPVFYSDNEYESPQKNTSVFLIPYNPPQQMTFSYGTSEIEQKLLVKVYKKTNQKNVYYTNQKIISINEGKQGNN